MKKYYSSIIILAFLMFTMSLVIADPHAFEGNIIVDDDSNPNGYTLVAYLDGIALESGSIENWTFGSQEGVNSLPPFIIEDYDDNQGIIEFYIGDEKAEETFNFVGFEITFTNLTFSTIPETIDTTCGDAICQIGECSSCPTDCSVNSCNSNGVCDVDVGEMCVNAPEDCGVCEEPESNNNNEGSSSSGGGSSGGGGGGGSSSSGSSIDLSSSSDNTEDENENTDTTGQQPVAVKALNENNQTAIRSDSKTLSSWITGNVVANPEDFEGITMPGIIFLLLLGLSFLFVVFKKNKAE